MADPMPEAAREAVAEVFARILTERNPGWRFVPLRQAGAVVPSQIVWLVPPESESKAAPRSVRVQLLDPFADILAAEGRAE